MKFLRYRATDTAPEYIGNVKVPDDRVLYLLPEQAEYPLQLGHIEAAPEAEQPAKRKGKA